MTTACTSAAPTAPTSSPVPIWAARKEATVGRDITCQEKASRIKATEMPERTAVRSHRFTVTRP